MFNYKINYKDIITYILIVIQINILMNKNKHYRCSYIIVDDNKYKLFLINEFVKIIWYYSISILIVLVRPVFYWCCTN